MNRYYYILKIMTGYEYICEAIKLFENSLVISEGGNIIKTVAELAKLTGYSVYHFTRLFYAVTGVYPKEYISGRILSEAAKMIADTSLPLAVIAQNAGFMNYETFSRAFRKRFGFSPARVRDLRYLPFEKVIRAVPEMKKGTINLVSREPEIISLDAFYITGLPFYIEEGTRSFHKHWAAFMRAEKMISGRVLPETFCQFSAWCDCEPPGGMSILCALETAPGAVQIPFFTTREVPASSYISFQHKGNVSALYETYQFIYQDWFASHEIKPLDFWEFQRYSDGGDTTEIYIPVDLS